MTLVNDSRQHVAAGGFAGHTRQQTVDNIVSVALYIIIVYATPAVTAFNGHETYRFILFKGYIPCVPAGSLERIIVVQPYNRRIHYERGNNLVKSLLRSVQSYYIQWNTVFRKIKVL